MGGGAGAGLIQERMMGGEDGMPQMTEEEYIAMQSAMIEQMQENEDIHIDDEDGSNPG
jgi:hypothetical protein